MAMFKGFKPQGLQKIANSMGYTGSLEGFSSYLQQNPDKQNMMNMYNQRAMQMAQGGAVRKMQTGGSLFGQVGTPEQQAGMGAPTYVNPITPKKDQTASIFGKFPMGNPIPGALGAPVGSLGATQPKTIQDMMVGKPVGQPMKTSPGFDPRYEGRNAQDYGQRNQMPVPKNASNLPDYEAFKKYQSTIPNNMFRMSSAVIVPRRLADGTVVNFGSPLQAEDYDNYLKSIGKPPTTSTQGGIFQNLYLSDEQADQVAGGFPKKGTEEFNRITGGGGFPAQEPNRTDGIIRPSNIGDRRSEGFPSPIASESQRLAPWMEGYDFVGKKSLEEMNADLDKREREYKEANPNWEQEFQDEMERDRQRQRDLQNFNPNNISQPTGTTMATDTNIEDFSVQQALNPTLPQGGATVAAGTPITQDQMVDPATGQLRPQAPTVGSAALGTTTTSTAPTATPAAQMDASLSNLNVTQALQPVQAAQGAVSQQSQMTAQQQTSSKVSDLQAAQGAATLMQNPVQREIQAGELISGGAANAQKASTYAEQIEAATATPSAQATVQGQLANLTADFDATNPPAWAAGALRGVQAQMAARGLGTSSMAAQAMIQGALESALPIAQADAQTRASFEAANLSNRQQRAMLAAQQRAAFIGQEFDQEFQTRVQNAAKISDIANMNFTAEQQIALENSRAANTMGLANLSNRQAMVMAEASALANLDMSNLNNRQQAAVQNAQAFMQMDMANLNNSQQTGMFKAQSLVQSLFNDQAATNASRQFNASSQNQTDQFFANLATTVANFNAEQANAMSRYNSGELNALEQFNANMKNQREQFNAQNRLVIDQSNAQWRRQVATADTAAINRANELNARALIDMSTGAYNNLWQGFRDDMEFAWKSADNAEERNKDILLRKMQDESTVAAAALAADQALVDNLVTGLVGLSTADTGTTMVGKAFDFVSDIDYKGLWDTGKGVVDKIINWF